MHGRPREYKHKLRDPKAQEAYKKKVDAIRRGTALVLECRRMKRYDEAVMDASAKLLKVVPEIYTIWNFRREALTPVFEAGGDAAQKASDGELALTQACLMENPKSYSTWHHRKWVVLRGLANLQSEMKLIARALDEDRRNFHAWNYRQFIVKVAGTSTEQELAYTEEKVIQDFSNYSAWHYRTILLPRTGGGPEDGTGRAEAGPGPTAEAAAAGAAATGAFSGSAGQARPIPVSVLDDEYDMVHQAFATDSRDQSPWMYYRWLVGNSLAHVQLAMGAGPGEEEAARAVLRAVLEREGQRFEQDHLAQAPDMRWPLLTVARLKEAQARLGLCGEEPGCGDASSSGAAGAGAGAGGAEAPQGAGGGGSGCGGSLAAERLMAEVRAIYERLQALDPMRKGYYRDAAEGKAFVVVQALGTV